MNRLVLETPGFPFDMQTLEVLQQSTQPYISGLARILPNRCRLSGVEVVVADPGSVSDGMIYWDGELLPFKGGDYHSQFSILEEIIERDFNIGSPEDPELEEHPAYVKRWAEIGNIPGAESVHNISALGAVPNFLVGLKKGAVYCGTVVPVLDPTGMKIDVTFPSIGTSNYIVLGSFVAGAGVNEQISYLIKEITATGFKLHLVNIVEPIPYVFFRYVIIPQ